MCEKNEWSWISWLPLVVGGDSGCRCGCGGGGGGEVEGIEGVTICSRPSMAVALGKVRNVRIKIAMRITANRREVAMGEREREREYSLKQESEK